MSFIRVKEIGKTKKYRYAYLVENKWKKRINGGRKGSRQKVIKYLGKVLKFEMINNGNFFEVMGIDDIEKYCKNRKSQILDNLIKYELFIRGFETNGNILEKEDDIAFDISTQKFINTNGNEEKIVIEMNEGFLCTYTLRRLFNFKKDIEDERESGIKLAKSFLEAGLRIPKETFVSYFEKI